MHVCDIVYCVLLCCKNTKDPIIIRAISGSTTGRSRDGSFNTQQSGLQARKQMSIEQRLDTTLLFKLSKVLEYILTQSGTDTPMREYRESDASVRSAEQKKDGSGGNIPMRESRNGKK